ncbi:hypothetical protein PS723_06125 [Pseudomonas fluorescens]|uniref:Uncharacterized protein n=1 Tax=Pseudomonas fluorescens TaxID=294 RepID=A0A5E7FUW2_PSEFL|nr:hypothetical protein PS723_02460 [Pseudomonas fluorescens]VVO21286.1 hypothetical protein PS723_04226 [Pseudomonas fluorescens]VVO43139.1 hypothetical protein PS723_06125 [Pseudomonas fluorescens]
MFAALDNPARQGLSWNIDAVATEYFFEAMQGQAVDVFGRQQHRQDTWASHAFFNQLSGLVRCNWCGFAIAATVDLAHMFDHADLHRHDFELLADFLANAVFTATAGAGQLVIGQFMDDFDTRKIGGQRLAFAPSLGRSYNLFFNRFVDRLGHAFSFIEQGHLRRRGIGRLL